MSDDIGVGDVLDQTGKVVAHILWEREGGTVRIIGLVSIETDRGCWHD